MNPSTSHARAAVSALVEAGVGSVVLAPGSRSAPLAYALADAEEAGLLNLHVRLDERDAAFTALGLSRAALLHGGGPAAVVMTSGTAVANAHPAVLEASYSRTPMLVLSADRPEELRGVGANQAMRAQHTMFGDEVRAALDVSADAGDADWARLAREGVSAATGGAGPVQLNLAFRDPLVPDAGDERWAPAPGTPEREARPAGAANPARLLPDAPGTVLLAGDTGGLPAPGLSALATSRGWPVLAEVVSPLRRHPHAIGGYRRLLATGEGPVAEIARVITLGRPTLSRPVSRLLARADVDHTVITPDPAWFGAAVPGARYLPELWPGGVEGAQEAHGDPGHGAWLASWRAADDAGALARPADGGPLGRPTLARALAEADGTLFVGSSQVVRDLDEVPTVRPTVLASRGLAGIDGLVSTAGGFALAADEPVRLVLGDVSAVHDVGGLLTPTLERRPPLEVVVVDDDGGGIFAGLEHGHPRFAHAFSRVFATPHGTDFRAVAAAFGWAYTPVATDEELHAALALGVVPGRLVHVSLPPLGR